MDEGLFIFLTFFYFFRQIYCKLRYNRYFFLKKVAIKPSSIFAFSCVQYGFTEVTFHLVYSQGTVDDTIRRNPFFVRDYE